MHTSIDNALSFSKFQYRHFIFIYLGSLCRVLGRMKKLYFSERLDMFSQVFRECLLSKVLIASLLGKPNPVCVLQYGALHHAVTSISQEREENWKIIISLEDLGNIWELMTFQSRLEYANGASSFWIFFSSDCLICHILKTQSEKLFNIIGFYHKITYYFFRVWTSFSWCSAL